MVAFDPSASSFSGRPVSPPAILPDSSKSLVHPHHLHDFWQHRWVQNVLPFATSLIIHLGILAVGIALYQVVTEVRIVPKEQVTIPESAVVPKSDMAINALRSQPDSLLIPGAQQDRIQDAVFDGPSMTIKSAPDGGGPGKDEPNLFNGVQESSSGGPGKNPFGVKSDGLAPFGVPRTGGMPSIHLIPGDGGGAGQRVIYLCDASGSMLGVFGSLKQKLKASINGLAAESGQEFNVIFFSDDNCFPLFKDGAHFANADNKKLAFDFIDNAVSTGGTQPLPAIKFAISEKPDLLFVLTDGFDQIANFDDVVKAFRDGNKDKLMQVNCIFLESDSDPKLEKVLQQIANDGHGKYTKVRKEDM